MKALDIIEQWPTIRKHFSKSFFSSLHCSIASVTVDNIPTVSPIGTVFLNQDQTGFYFERFTQQLPEYAKDNTAICVMAVNSSKRFWVRSLYRGRFIGHPAIRLYGELGDFRKASDSELRALTRRLRFTSRLKGHKALWNGMTHVRELRFTRAEKMSIGSMTQDL